MATLSPSTWIGNAHAVLNGSHGAITQFARHAGCSRQTAYQHAQRVHHAVADLQTPGPTRAQLQAELQQLQQQQADQGQILADAVTFGKAAQQHFTATAAALGLSLTQTGTLLACVLPALRCPRRSTLGHWVQQACVRASATLAVLDSACSPLVGQLCLDEIFCHRVPVLMGVEPHSLCWLLGQRGPDRTGATWYQALLPFTDLEAVACDNGSGLQRGLEDLRASRQEAGPPRRLEVTLDLFHTRREGDKALRQEWSAAQRLWEQAEEADRALAQTRRRGQDQRADRQRARHAWDRAEQAFHAACRQEAAWRRALAALQLFRADGQLNERSWAQAEIAQAVAELSGARWAKLRRMLADGRSVTFLDQLQRQLEAAEPRAEFRAALVALWRVRHATRPGCGPGPGSASPEVLHRIRERVCALQEADWHGAYRRVARVLEGLVRASSVVECLNSVVRMHQARHRTMPQGLLDLKRLYWNCREFGAGKRKKQCPYQHLGLPLPSYDWWTLLQTEPDQIGPKVSTSSMAA